MTKSLYSEDAYSEIVSRINKVTAGAKPEWGTMTAAQMLAHSSEVLEVANGKALENTPWIAKLFKGYIKKMVISEKPYPKSSQTHPQYVQKEDRDIEAEKERLLAALATFKSQRGHPIEHPLFGLLTEDEKGWAQYKHLDHHLTQFGV